MLQEGIVIGNQNLNASCDISNKRELAILCNVNRAVSCVCLIHMLYIGQA